jgi:CHAD domain-containing protein
MGYRIRAGKPKGKEIKRIFSERLAMAAADLEAYPREDPQGLHAARKNIKRLRALLRLLGCGKHRPIREVFDPELRHAAQSLSGNRDREVMIGLLKRWSVAEAGNRDGGFIHACGSLAAFLTGNESTHPELDPQVRIGVGIRMDKLGKGFRQACIGKVTQNRLEMAFNAREKRMGKAFRTYMRHPSMEAFHEWRKRVKDHMYHRDLLADVLAVKKSRSSRIRKLEEMLSGVRDCDLLLEYLMKRAGTGLELAEIASLIHHAETEKERTLKEALRLAEALFGPAEGALIKAGKEQRSSPVPTPP